MGNEKAAVMGGILVHEWLAPTGGSENVFEQLIELFPDAERWCLWNSSEGRFLDVHETLLAKTPLRHSKALAVPFMPLAWRALPKRDADWVLCSSHAFAHQAQFRGPAREAPKLVYAHTPARYVWVPEADRRGTGPVARAISRLLRPTDRRRAEEPRAIAANSRFVAARIARAWHREATVIYPPVDVASFEGEPSLTVAEQALIESLPRDFVLGASRFVSYKRLDDAIRVGTVSSLPVVLAGRGPDEPRLREIAQDAAVPVEFVIDPSRGLLQALYRRAVVLVFAPVEDFGIMPVEAMATGTPVIVNTIGGASESVVHGETGAHVHDWESDSELRAAVALATTARPEACIARARDFSSGEFGAAMTRWVAEASR